MHTWRFLLDPWRLHVSLATLFGCRGAYGPTEMKPWSGLKPCSGFPAAEHVQGMAAPGAFSIVRAAGRTGQPSIPRAHRLETVQHPSKQARACPVEKLPAAGVKV